MSSLFQPLKVNGNSLYHILQQSTALHFVTMKQAETQIQYDLHNLNAFMKFLQILLKGCKDL
jgi:hypothetical protein